ncbi:hypothetical protein SCUP234_11022 [Seiridium cupressi]
MVEEGIASHDGGALLNPLLVVASLSLEAIYEELRRIDNVGINAKQHNDTNNCSEERSTYLRENVDDPPSDKVDEMEQRRTALRTRAMELSRDRIRQLSVLDLPLDLFREICDHLRDIRLESGGRSRAYKNMRFVCRLFNQVASPHLYPCLRIELNQESLERAKIICDNRLLALGIEEVMIGLQYRPRELATDLAQFVKFRRNELGEMQSRCYHYLESWQLGGYDEDDDTVCPLPYKDYDIANDNIDSIRRAWNGYVETGEMEIEGATLEYVKILIEGHDSYRQKHEEQLRLIQDGTFVRAVAALFSRLPRRVALTFSDETEHDLSKDYVRNPTIVPSSKEELLKFLKTSQDWSTIEGMEGEPQLTAAKILSDLPIACHKAGVPLHDIKIRCFPTRNNYSMVAPESWDDLRSACQKVEEFEFARRGMSCLPIRHEHIPPGQVAYINGYLGAMFSSRCLISVDVSMRVFGINDGQTDKDDHYHLGAILLGCDSSRLRKFILSNMSLNQEELEPFCRRLGDRLEKVWLTALQLREGKWADTLDILREKIAPRYAEGDVNLYVTALVGGEFGQKAPGKNDAGAWMFWSSSQWDELMKDPEIIVQTREYIAGNGTVENPLRGQEQLLLNSKRSLLRVVG